MPALQFYDMKNPARKFGVLWCVAAMLFSAARIEAQTPLVSYQEVQEKLCIAQPIADNRTYDFRILPRAQVDKSTYGRKRWYSPLKKLIPFWSSDLDERYGIDDIRTLQSKYGRKAPIGESNRSRQIRLNAEKKILSEQSNGEQKWMEWLEKNPSATAEERKKAEVRLRFQGLNIANLPKFDWREYLEFGEAGNQGFNCNTCWAFAAVDAMQLARQILAIRSEKNWNNSLQPSARQLISCMVPEADYCKINWHGEAFTFMVDKGLPLGGSTKYMDSKIGWGCDAEKRVRALTWDYVQVPPDKIAPVDEIKRAVILYGAVVTTVKFDSCLWLYGTGIFNETQNQEGTHVLLIVGWDDTKGAWLVKNSYGTDWGENGFGWIKYGTNNIGQWSAWVAADPKDEEKLANGETERR